MVALTCATCTAAVLAQTTPRSPDMGALPIPSSAHAADIAAIASGFDARVAATAAAETLGPKLLILVSFSMPPASLARLSDQSRLAGATLVLRGLKDDSLTATAVAVHQMFGQTTPAIQIDPRPFARYEVNAVPAFILLPRRADDQNCSAAKCGPGGFAKAVGDVSLDYALEQIAATHPNWAPAAKTYLSRLGK